MFFQQFKNAFLGVLLGLLAGACAEPGFNQGSNTQCAGFFCVTSTNTASGAFGFPPTAGQYFGGRQVGISGIQKKYVDPSSGWQYVGWELDNPDGKYAGRVVYRRWLNGPSAGTTEVAHVNGTSYPVDIRHAYSRQARG